ncbi:MAG: helix-turn-helix transcriptional regulator [Planctomycetes bacterium]|nr:helix-turn-helix transcriptional regulator [Planctomycetota bacterium]
MPNLARQKQRTAEQLFGRELPALARALTPERIFFDRSRRARRLTHPPPKWAMPPKGFPPAHRHPHFELCVPLTGRCPFLLGEVRREMRRGDLAVLSPETFHRELAAERCGPYELLWLPIMRTSAGAHIQIHYGGGRFSTNAFRAWANEMTEGLPLLEAIDLELWSNQPGAFHRVQGLLLQLFGYYERALARPASKSSRTSEGEDVQRWRVEKAVEYLRDHFNRPVDLGEVAHHVGVSSGYLSAMFTRSLGRSFTDFLAACRLEEAEKLLADPSLSVKEIAARVGIDNPFYFSRLFRKRTGASPQQFRRRLARQSR